MPLMPVSANQRAKLLHLMKVMLDKTDVEHPLTMKVTVKAELTYQRKKRNDKMTPR